MSCHICPCKNSCVYNSCLFDIPIKNPTKTRKGLYPEGPYMNPSLSGWSSLPSSLPRPRSTLEGEGGDIVWPWLPPSDLGEGRQRYDDLATLGEKKGKGIWPCDDYGRSEALHERAEKASQCEGALCSALEQSREALH